jgi:hypothetical protein
MCVVQSRFSVLFAAAKEFERRIKLEKQVAEEEMQALRMDNETVRKIKEQENYDLLFQNQRLMAQVATLEDEIRRSLQDGEAMNSSVLSSRRLSETGSRSGGGDQDGMMSSSSSQNHLNEKQFIDQIQHLSNLLSDSEETIERLLSQERVLKAEIRRLDGLEGLQNAQLP